MIMHRVTLPQALATLVLAATLAPAASWAARPLASETADSLEKGNCEQESAWLSIRSSGQPSASAIDLLVACGIGHDTQLSAGYTRLRSAGLTDQSLNLAGKTTLVPIADGRIGWALAYAASLDKAAGQGWRHEGTRLLGVGTTALAAWLTGHVNLGWQRSRSDRQSSTVWSLGLEGDTGWRWTADLFGDDRSRPWASAGVLLPVSEKFSVNAAYAQQFESPRVRQWSLAFKLDF